jgi:hypothetical protein
MTNAPTKIEDWDKIFQLSAYEQVPEPASLPPQEKSQVVEVKEKIGRSTSRQQDSTIRSSSKHQALSAPPLSSTSVYNKTERRSLPTTDVSSAKKSTRAGALMIDRPAHWGKQSTIKYVARLDKQANDSRRQSTGSIIRTADNSSQRQPLSETRSVMSIGQAEISFKPSWLQSISSSSTEIRRSSLQAIREDEIMTDGLDDRHRSLSPISRARADNNNQAISFEDSGNRLVTPVRYHHQQQQHHADYSSPSSKLAKAKPGSLRFRLQKLRRTIEADRTFQLAVDRSVSSSLAAAANSNSSDLRDPRNRAHTWIDLRLLQLVEAGPMLVIVNAIVTNIHRRDETATSAVAANMALMNENEDAKLPEHVEDDDQPQENPFHEILDHNIPVYFRSKSFHEHVAGSSNVMSTNALENMELRIYDPVILLNDQHRSRMLLCVNIVERI